MFFIHTRLNEVVPIIMDAKLNLLRTGQVIRELSGIILNRGPKLCNFVEWRGFRVVYRRLVICFAECYCLETALVIVIYEMKPMRAGMLASTSACVLMRKTTNWRFLISFIIMWRYWIVISAV